MQDFDPFHTHDDETFDVEITDLDAAEQAETGEESARLRGERSEVPAPVPARRSRSGLRRRWSTRQRALQAVVTVMVALLLLSVFVSNSSSMRNVITGLLHPMPSPMGESDFFYVQGNPPWGQLFIDGRHVVHLPPVSGPPLRLSHGLHLLSWQASPFEPVSCTISVPADSGLNTCLAGAVPVNANVFAWLITFTVSLANLPHNPRAALLHSVQAALDTVQSTDTVRAGELYAVASSQACKPSGRLTSCFATAHEPLTATLRFALDTQLSTGATTCISPGLGNTCVFQQQDCHLFCAFPAQLFHIPPAFSTDWNVFVVARASWTYALPGGRIIARNQPDSFLDFEQGNEYFMAMHISWNGTGWSVSVLPGQLLSSPTCTEAANEVEMGSVLGDSKIPFPLTWNFVSAAPQAAGCLAVASATQQTNTTPPPSTYPLPGAYVLQRFGVLLAANVTAHRYWPYLPLADSYEQNLAHQLAIQLAENL